MYRTSSPGQLSFENFYQPFGGKLSGENRWVKLAELIPWETVEAEYAEQFSATMGAPAKSFVSITQPYVRPIVRGKAGVPVEFGAKLSVSCVQGCVFLDVLSWDNFNESTHL